MANGGSRSLDLGAISERLHSNEVNLQRLGEDTNRQIRDLATATTSQINSLATATQAQTNQLGQQISKLDNSLQERGKIQWPAFSLLLGAITVIAALIYWPISESLKRNELVAKEDRTAFATALAKVVDTTPSTREIAATGARRDDWQRYAEERFKNVEKEANEQQKAIVPRGEHEEKWRSVEQRFADHQRQLDAIKADFSGLYRPRDALESIQRRLEFLESSRTQALK